MVPLYREPDIAARLVKRLGALTYPRELLDVMLVVEEDDHLTRTALAASNLPHWMRVIPVPDSDLRTKPRALNYALNFARGRIIGVYDAEDAPAADQLHRVTEHFATAGPDLACIQGVLDYYNPRTNWLSRCFTIEYAAWFRLMLPGLAKLGLVVPLGGTTLFFRREILERLGGWDAHNVTEDADLGLRLARHGYRTELLDTVTMEEANCRVWPWIKQRSRWLKGYAMTYAVHMRDPLLLWRQLGARRFIGVQLLFLGTLIQFLLAPILWSFWLMLFGLGHPLADALPGWALVGVAGMFHGCSSEVAGLTINMVALRHSRHRFLRPWAFDLHVYFPLAARRRLQGLLGTDRQPLLLGQDRSTASTTPARQPASALIEGARSAPPVARFQFQPRLERAGDMLAQRLVGAVAVAARDGLDHRLMLVQRHAAAPLGLQRGGRQQGHRAMHQIELLDQEAVVRGEVNLPVKPLVRAAQRLGIVHQLAILDNHVVEHAHFFDRGVFRRQPRRQPFEFGAHHVELGQLVVIQRGDDQ